MTLIGGTDCSEAIARLVDAAPALNDLQYQRLRDILHPARHDLRRAASTARHAA